MTIAAGSRLGPYEVVAPIGAGGMGEVWRGRDTRLDRSVAIKILPPGFASNAQLKLRFEREARAISQLNHPHICTLYDVGDSYLVMELLEGESLADRIAKGPLPLEQVLRYGMQIADALDKAHRQGIVHRDLKPGNVMITKSGAKLLDFGLAKTDVSVVDVSSATEHRPLTQEGTILGTFQYMAPEQLEGVPADARTDIFALGAVLYEMATGKRAFDGKTKTSLIAAIVSAEPKPISEIQPLTPPAFEHVVRKCLAKDPDDRWQSAHDIAGQLRWISEAGSQAGVAAPLVARKKSRERLWWALGVAVALGAGLFAPRAFHLGRVATPQYRFTVPMIDSAYKFGVSPALSPDGRTLFFRAVRADGQNQIYRRRLDEFIATAIPGTDNASSFVLLPDGRSMVLAFPGAVLKRVSVDGGPLQPLADGLEGGFGPSSGGTITADGTIILGGGGIRRLLPGGRVEWLLKPDKTRNESGYDWPRLLPDGKRFLFVSTTRDPDRGTIERTLCAGTIGSKEITRIGDIPTRVEYALGHVFFVREGTLMAQPFDASALKLTGEPVPVAEDVLFNRRSGDASFSVTATGTIAYKIASLGSHIMRVDPSGRSVGQVANHALGRFGIVPGGDQIVMTVIDVHAGLASLWLRGLTRETATRLTQSLAFETNPVVTPDGRRVFFTTDLIAGGPRIFEAPIDGSTPPKLLIPATSGVQVANDISRDGRFLVYQSNEHQTVSKQDLWILPLTGTAKPFPFLATPAVENSGAFSPDGKWIAYASDIDTPGIMRIFVRPFPGPGPAHPVSTERGAFPRFSRDGKTLYFADEGKLMAADFRADGSVSEPRVALTTDETIQTFEQTADGRFLMLLQNDAEGSPPVRIITGWTPPAN
jgi:Tol biopolymer transport system component